MPPAPFSISYHPTIWPLSLMPVGTSRRAEGIIARGVLAVAVDEATLSVAARSVGAEPVPDDLAVVVDAGGKGAFRAERIVEHGELAVTVEVAVEELEAAGVLISPDDLAVVIDAIGACVFRTRNVDRLVVVVAVQEAMGDAGLASK